ncbi:cysteine desulfurase NifS [Oscillospiraceae bacterium MB08-C2-2]|nr:cysteine desulfurase NifS [Oscillospiraceae bacterium MB08-C2-2]
MKRFVYADNAATTPITDDVLAAMIPYLKEGFGNPSSIYSKGREAKIALEKAREQVAGALGAASGEIYFTSCGSESDNWAIEGVARMLQKKGKKHIITTNIEHHAVLHTVEALVKEGFEATYLPVDELGLVSAAQVADAIREDTALITVMYANNEIGTIQPIAEIGEVCRAKGVLFHTDAVQAVGNVAIDVAAQKIDLLSLTGHKLHAPKGVGALYVRKGVNLPPLLHGGGQERGKRAGTENVASIVALGFAVEKACSNIETRTAHIKVMRDRLIDTILEAIPLSRLNGDRERRLCGNVNVAFEGIEGEGMLLMLDMAGICASSGSACTSGSLDPSHVLLALGLPHEKAHGSLRLSINELTSAADIDAILETLPPIVERLRAMSPLWEKITAQK